MRVRLFVLTAILAAVPHAFQPDKAMKTETFDRDPGWDGVNNRPVSVPKRTVVQDFGFRLSAKAGGEPGEAGGVITPCGEAAYYAARIPVKTLDEPLEASGKFMGEGREFNVLLGFFNSGTVNEWRTPNTIALRFYGRGDVFYPYLEYCTSKWRAGADSPGGFTEIKNAETGRSRLVGFDSRKPHTWSLRYDPSGNKGAGSITAVVDGETSICYLGAGHKSDGARFNRFGLLNVVKSADGGGPVWIDDVAVNGIREDFRKDPRWEGLRNRVTYDSAEVRRRFDFGFSPTRFAGGERAGELGGLVYRGDDRSADSMAYYADRVESLRLDKPIRAAGRVSLRRAVSDSTTLIGFFHSRDSMRVNPKGGENGFPDPFFGIAIEGPSSEGFFFYPAYHIRGERAYADGSGRPRILPNGSSHAWSLEYDSANARITVAFAGSKASLQVTQKAVESGLTLDRFGIVTTTTDGNGQVIYFDDLTYTAIH